MKEASAQRPDGRAPGPLETWSAPEVHLSIEYAAQILDEINAYAIEGLKQLSRNGIAVGGVLFGSRRDKSVRILTWRPIACEHIKGSALFLSPADRKALAQLLQEAKSDRELEGLHAIGWFVSHTREGILLNESDLEIYSHFFPWSWQITLVVRPSRDWRSRAGFFVRNSEGRVKSDASHREFQIDGAGAAPARSVQYPVIAEYGAAANEAGAAEPAAVEPGASAATAEVEPATPAGPKRSLSQARIFSDRRLWIWAVPVILALIVWAVVWQRPAAPPVSPSLGFRAFDSKGQLRLDWDQSSKAIEEATRGTLYIRDGGTAPVRLALDTSQLDAGTYLYARKSADVEVVLTVFPREGKPVEESARFVGPPVNLPHSDDSTELRKQRDVLVKENARLRDDLRRETNRNRDLEEAIKALKNRVEVEQSQKRK